MTITWLGGRDFEVTDLRFLPGPVAFEVTTDGGRFRARIKEGSDTARELAELIGKSSRVIASLTAT